MLPIVAVDLFGSMLVLWFAVHVGALLLQKVLKAQYDCWGAAAVLCLQICDDTLTGFRKRDEADSSDGSESPQRSGPSYTRPTTASAAQGAGRGRSPTRCVAW